MNSDSETDSSPLPPWRVMQLASTSDMGGTERMILFLVESLDRLRFESYVGALIGGGELIRRAAPACAETRHFHFTHPLDPRGLANLTGFIRENRIDLVQTYGLRADTVGRIAAKLGGARVVFSSIRSIDPWRQPRHSALDRLTAPLVDLFVANSEAGKAATVKREGFPPDKIKVVHGGIPVREIPVNERNAVRAKYRIEPGAFPVIGILANLRDMKGHEDVVAALPAILAKNPETIFIFAGRDDSNGAIQKLARECGVDAAIRFIGYVADTPGLLAAMDIFMLPSHWEGLPASILEAMHAGLPIITTRVGGIPELVRDGEEALLIEPSSPSAISDAVNALTYDFALRARLARNARIRADTNFSISRMTSAMEELYEAALKQKGVTPRQN